MARDLLDKHYSNCRKNWWLTALYINNWLPFNDICLPQTWSQSVDFQLWILSYFPLIWLYKKPKLGVFSCLIMIAIGCFAPALVMYLYELPSANTGRAIEVMFLIIRGTEFPRMHFHFYNNMSSYFIGILLGYCCATNRKMPAVSTF